MKIFDWLFGRKESPTTPEPKATWQLPDPSNEEEYVRRCVEVEFKEEQETRTFRSAPAFANVLTPLNSQQYAQAIKAGQAILPRFPDFDLIYKWLGSAYRSTQQLPKCRDILSEGLGKAKRKCILLTDLGEAEWQSGNINEAVYWWSQALHCLSSNPTDYNAYLLLSYVAKGLDLTDFERVLLAHVDSLRGGQVRLDPATAGRLTTLVQNKKTGTMQKALKGLQSKYFSTKLPNAPVLAIEETIQALGGEPVETPEVIIEKGRSMDATTSGGHVTQEAASVSPSSKLSPEVLALAPALTGSNWTGAQAAAAELVQIGDAGAVEVLARAVCDAEEDYRKSHFAEALAEIGDGYAVGALLGLLAVGPQRQGSSGAGSAAAEALGAFREARVVDALIPAFQEPIKFKRVAAEALGKIQDSRAVEPLIGALRKGDSAVSALPAEAARALGRIGDSRAVEALIAALQDTDVAVVAASALGKIRDPRAVASLLGLIKVNDKTLRETAAKALGEIRDSSSVEPLAHELQSAAEPPARCGAAMALGRLGDARALEPLLAALKDFSPEVRYEAAEALERIGDNRAVEPLIAALQETEHYIAKAAARALGVIGDARAVDSLIAVLQKEPIAAAMALGRIRDARAAEPLIAMLQSTDGNIASAKEFFMEALGAIGSAPAANALLEVLKQGWGANLAQAAKALASIADVTAIDAAVELLLSRLRGSFKEKYGWTEREAAAEGLYRIKY